MDVTQFGKECQYIIFYMMYCYRKLIRNLLRWVTRRTSWYIPYYLETISSYRYSLVGNVNFVWCFLVRISQVNVCWLFLVILGFILYYYDVVAWSYWDEYISLFSKLSISQRWGRKLKTPHQVWSRFGLDCFIYVPLIYVALVYSSCILSMLFGLWDYFFFIWYSIEWLGLEPIGFYSCFLIHTEVWGRPEVGRYVPVWVE